MLIYTSNPGGEKLKIVRELGMGVMIASSPNRDPNRSYRGVPCALDNGAFQCWRRGFPFMDEFFLQTLRKCYVLGLSLNFVVCPDMVARGLDSLRFSVRYATEKLPTAHRLALAVQDGMSENMVDSAIRDGLFSHLFVGGTLEWKWRTARRWVQLAHDHGMKCHIGRCGTLQALERAESMGVDSVDSASFVRNDSWDIVRQFQGTAAASSQMALFGGSV